MTPGDLERDRERNEEDSLSSRRAMSRDDVETGDNGLVGSSLSVDTECPRRRPSGLGEDGLSGDDTLTVDADSEDGGICVIFAFSIV